MATRTWNKERAAKRIKAKIDALSLKNIEIKEYVRDTDLSNLKSTVAYRLDGVHLYADILNLSDLLNDPRGLDLHHIESIRARCTATASQREAVTDERDVFRDALRRGMGETTYGQVRAAFNGRSVLQHVPGGSVNSQKDDASSFSRICSVEAMLVYLK